MMRFLSFLLVALLCAFSTALAAEFSVPEQVSQGHAFPVFVQDTKPFTATFRWRGETLKVKASKDSKRKRWKAELLLGMPIDAFKAHVLSRKPNCFRKKSLGQGEDNNETTLYVGY